MAIIAGVTVNWRTSPRIITIPSPITEVTIVDLQDTLLDLEDNDEGMLWPHLRNTSGGEDLGGGTSVGWTMELQNAVIAFQSRTGITSSGTATTANPDGITLIDSGATFITDGVTAGATIHNDTDGSVTTVISVDSETQLTHYALAEGTDNDWDFSDAYRVWNEIQCEVTGGNLVAVNDVAATISPFLPTFGTQIQRTSSSSATFQENLAIQYASFQNSVWVDVNATENGQLELGTHENPVKTLEQATAIAQANGFEKISFLSDYTFGATVSIADYEIVGQGLQKTEFTFVSGCILARCEFFDCIVGGTALGIVGFTRCKVKPLVFPTSILTDAEIVIDNCLFQAGTTQLPSNFNGKITMDNCKSDVAGGGPGQTPILDINGSSCEIIQRDYYGGFKYIGGTHADFICSIDMSSGQMVFDSATISAGDFTVRGAGKLIDENGNYISTGTWNGGVSVTNELSTGNHTQDLWKNQGLDKDNPLVIKTNGSRRTSDDVDLVITDDGTDVTVTRQ